MDMSDFIDTISDDPADFAEINRRLSAAHLAGAQAWTSDGICSAVGIIMGDYNIDSLTTVQLLRISVLINSMWAPYPVHLKRSTEGATRRTVLRDYLAGHYMDVAALRGHDPTLSNHTSPDPAAPSVPPPPPPSYDVTPPPNKPVFASLADTPLRAAPGATVSSAVRHMSQFYTPARQYGGREDESLARARTTFFRTCDAFNVPYTHRNTCIQFAVKQTEHNLPALVHDLDGIPADAIWDAIETRVCSTARDLRNRTLWQTTSLANEPRLAGDTEVVRFERMIGKLVTMQTQLPVRYHTAAMLTDKIMDAIRGEWFAATVIPDSAGDPHILTARIKLMLTTGPPTSAQTTTTTTLSPAPAATPAVPATPTYMTSDASDTAAADTDTMSVSVSADDPAHPNRVYYVLKRFRANSSTPYRTDHATARPFRSFRGPGPNNPCHICQGTDHFARDCSNLPRDTARPPRDVRLGSTADQAMDPEYTPPPLIVPPPIPTQEPPAQDPAPFYLLAASWAVSEPAISTAILDIGSPGDIVGDAWLARNPQQTTSPMVPSTTRWALGHDVPDTIGCTSLKLRTKTTAGAAMDVHLPQVFVLRHDTVPLLVGLPSHKRLNLVVL